MKKSLVITAFDRPKLLEKCLESVFQQPTLGEYNIVVVQQKGDERVNQIIRQAEERFSTLVCTDGSGASTDAKITNNRILGLMIAFDFWKSDFVISIEDDVEIASDAFHFVEEMYKCYHEDSRFRGVNFGSKLHFNEERHNTYSRLRFGLHGPASMITSPTWKLLKPNRVLKNDSIIFDAQIEFAIKSGFMVTPNASRYIDCGLVGSHTGKNPDLSYFDGLKRSFAKIHEVPDRYYELQEFHDWRDDCVNYKRGSNLLYDIKWILYGIVLSYPNLFGRYLKFKKVLRK
jgi:hypothetical protein